MAIYQDRLKTTEVQSAVIKRLIVLIPDQDVDEVKFSRSVKSLVPPDIRAFLLITLVHNPDTELTVRRRLATIAALMKGPLIKIETQILWDKSWIKAVDRVVKTGDAIICPAERSLSSGIGKKKPLSECLYDALHVPVYVLSGFFPVEPKKWLHTLGQTIYWVIILAIFVGFFLFETKIDLIPDKAISQIFGSVTMIIEIILIYLWTSIAG
jgi:hypothetical protein